ncbi:MAG: putative short-subunit dehydrogenase-like oxidoreductase (DUF2520 family) [Saprospiraceae bacterium]|jgi:predicted short-subunit dehydrogenase-like oxidoreductase (DUF2520 family)
MSRSIYKVVLIGAGNVGHHLGHRFFEKGVQVDQVFSRKITKARKLAKAINASPINNLSQLGRDADLYIIAVHDDAIEEVAKQLSPLIEKRLVAHTSGAVASVILKPYFKNYGCFYPLQTFSITKKADFEALPLCIYSPQKANLKKLERIAEIICPNVYEINDPQKSALHVAAVFVNNFTNHLYSIAKQLTAKEDINFDILKPLILETADKIQQHDPREMQTGPARRGDKKTIQNHLHLLRGHPDWEELYQLFSQAIEKEF